jgi:hypothetical protein
MRENRHDIGHQHARRDALDRSRGIYESGTVHRVPGLSYPRYRGKIFLIDIPHRRPGKNVKRDDVYRIARGSQGGFALASKVLRALWEAPEMIR